MKFKLSQITILVISALSVSTGMAATTSKTIDINNNNQGPIITGQTHSNDTIEYSGSIEKSAITIVGKESSQEGSKYFTTDTDVDGNTFNVGVNYDYQYFYSPITVKELAISDSNVNINGKADNLTVEGNSTVVITGSDAYANYRGANHENPSNPQSDLPLSRPGYDNKRQDEITISTANGTYNNESKQYLDGSHIGDVKTTKANGAQLTIKGSVVNDDRLGADKGEYLVSTDDTFNDSAKQIVGEKSLSQNAKFNGASEQILIGKNDRKAVSLDATFTGNEAAAQQHAKQTVGDNALAIDSTFDYAQQHVNSGGVAKNNTFSHKSSQYVAGKAENNTLTSGSNQFVSGTATQNNITDGSQYVDVNGRTVDNKITNEDNNRGQQMVSGTATTNTLINTNQTVEQTGTATTNTLTNGNQYVKGSATDNKITNESSKPGQQIISGTATTNTLINTDQGVEQNGIATTNTLTNGNQYVKGSATDNKITNEGNKRGQQIISGTATTNTLINTDQSVEQNGIATTNTLTNGNQYVKGNATDNKITNEGNKRGQQIISGTATTNTLINTDQTVEQNGIATTNTLTNGNQYVKGSASNNTITNQNKTPGEQIVSGIATTNTLTNVKQTIQRGGVATDNVLRGNSKLTIENGGEAKNNSINDSINMVVNAGGKATGKTLLNGTNNLALSAATTNGAYVEDLTLRQTKGFSTINVLDGKKEHDAVTIGTLNGKGDVYFEHANNPAGHTQMNINTLGKSGANAYNNTQLDFVLNSNILNGNSDLINMDNAYGQHYVTIMQKDSGKEAVRIHPQSADFAYINNSAGNSNAVFGMKDGNGQILELMDAGTYIHSIQTRKGDHNDTTWSFAATDRLTPSARAVIALSSAPQLMFNNEVDNMRNRLNMLRADDTIKNGVWLQAVGDRTKVNKDQIQYKLNHAGLELGADYQLALNEAGKLILGGFTGFDNGDVKNSGSGTSKVDSYTFGAYATYMANSGWYVDGLLKYNYFKNKLNTTSTNGYGVHSDDFHTSIWGMALETGYTFTFSNDIFMTPYGQFAFNNMGSKNITLNNEMEADIKSQRSLTTELGLNLGKDFTFNNGVMLSPYVKAAWNHQYENGNEVEFNQFNTITTDLSGSTGKFGAGFNTQYNNMNVYMEIQTIAGDSVKSPVNGLLGVRYNF